MCTYVGIQYGGSVTRDMYVTVCIRGGRKTLLLLMPPQQECTLKLRNWYEEHKHPAPSNKITGKSGKPELSVRDLLYDMDVAKRLCQERSVCSTIVGRLCVSEEDAQMAVTAIQQRLAPESVLLMPLSAFESALRALLQRLAAFFERPKSWEKPLAMAEERALPSEAEFGLWAATQSSVAVAEALVDIDRTYASTIAVGDVDTDADSQDIHNAQVTDHGGILCHGTPLQRVVIIYITSILRANQLF